MIEPAALAPLVTISDCKYGKMMHLTNDGFVGASLMAYGEFSEAEVDLFRCYVKSGDVVFDIGANIGAHTIALAHLVGPTGAVVAFEPIRYLFQMLCGNLALNGITYVRAFNNAAGKELGVMRVPPIDFTHPDNYGGLELGKYDIGDLCDVMPLDDFKLPRCDFLKIDVEGMELQVIEGAHGLIEQWRPVLYMENDKSDRQQSLTDLVAGLGYACYWHLPPLFNPRNYDGQQQNIFDGVCSQNMLCVPLEREQPTGLDRADGRPPLVLMGPSKGCPPAGAAGPDKFSAPGISEGG